MRSVGAARSSFRVHDVVAQEGKSVTAAFGREGFPKQPVLSSKSATVGCRRYELMSCFWLGVSDAAFEIEDVASGHHDVDAYQ